MMGGLSLLSQLDERVRLPKDLHCPTPKPYTLHKKLKPSPCFNRTRGKHEMQSLTTHYPSKLVGLDLGGTISL